MRFKLRTLLGVVAATALLLAQYPYVRFHVTRPARVVGGMDGGAIEGLLPAQSYYVPTARFAAVAGVEFAIAIVWFIYVRRQRTRNQAWPGGSSSICIRIYWLSPAKQNERSAANALPGVLAGVRIMKWRSLLYRSSLLAALVACLLTGCSNSGKEVEGPVAAGGSPAERRSAELAELRSLVRGLNEQLAQSQRQRAEIIELLVEIRTELRK